MQLKGIVLISALSCLMFICLADGVMKPNPRIESGSKNTKYEMYGQDQAKSKNDESNQINHNEIDDRIYVGEPFKSLLQTTARFALAQTKISNHINIDTAMDFINNLGYMLSRPSTLIKLVEIAAVTVVTILGGTLIFPGFYQFLYSAWKDPVEAFNLDRYLSNGLSERSVLGVLGSTTDEALTRVGLQDGSCRERSICYLGEIIKCTFPETSETVAKFATDNFQSPSYMENRYIKSFVAGFVDRNCSRIVTTDQGDNKNCLGNFINSVLVPRSLDNGRSKKYQTIQAVARA